MNIKKQQGETDLLYLFGMLAVIWVIFFVFLDIQLSIRAERVPHDKGIIESVKDVASKSFTVTDETFIEPENITNDINN